MASILVAGGTGAQGGGVIKALMASGKWRVKTITRNANTDKAKELKSKGVEVVECDLRDKEKLSAVLKGVYGAFLVTDFWAEPNSPQYEVECGKAFGDAAKQNNIQHLVYSTLPSAYEWTKGKYSVAHLESKAEVSKYLKSLQLPLTEVAAAFYYENFNTLFHPIPTKEGVYELAMPMGDKPMDMLGIEDLGPVVSYIFDHKVETLAKYYPICGDRLTMEQVAETFKKDASLNVKYVPVSIDEYKKLNVPNSEETGAMFQFFQDTSGVLFDLELSRKLNPNMKTFSKWIQEGHFRNPRK